MLTHVGYNRKTAVPAILVVVKKFQMDDAVEVTSMCKNLQCERLRGRWYGVELLVL